MPSNLFIQEKLILSVCIDKFNKKNILYLRSPVIEQGITQGKKENCNEHINKHIKKRSKK
jgi:hypothetical protein